MSESTPSHAPPTGPSGDHQTCLTAALDYAGRGWPVFPLHTPTSAGAKEGAQRARCSCGNIGCRSQGKHPRTTNGLKSATTDAEQIRRWWSTWPDANVGIATGHAFDVLDIDTDDAIDHLNEAHGINVGNLAGPCVATGTGWHCYVAPTGTGNQATSDGFDWRGAGGYVVVPPSLHLSGQRYEWVTERGPDAPLDAVRCPEKQRTALPPVSPSIGPSAPTGDRYADATVTASLSRVRSAAPGTRNHQLNASAYSIGRLIAAGLVDRSHLEAELVAAGLAAGLGSTEVEATVRSGINAGIEAGPPTPNTLDISTTPTKLRTSDDSTDQELHRPPEPETCSPAEVRSRLLSISQVLQLPPPAPLIGDWLDLGMLAEMPGKFGSLKSFAAMSMCLSVATGRPWLGEPIHQTGPAIYCSLEGAYTLGPRYAGWLENEGLEGADQLHTWGDKLNLLDERHLAEFGGLLAEIKPLLVVIDTLSKATPGAEENGSEFGSAVYTAMAHFRDCSGGTILAVHHSGHSATGRGRGHSSLEDDIDVVISFTGQWKEGPVLMKSEKQKARENPPQMWVGLDTTATGHPVLVPTVDRPDDEVDVKPLVMAIVTRYPGELTKADLTSTDSRGHVNAPRAKVRDAVDKLVAEGRVMFEKRRRDGDRQARDVLVPLQLTTTAAYKETGRRPSSPGEEATPPPTPLDMTSADQYNTTAAVVTYPPTRGNGTISGDARRPGGNPAAVVVELEEF